MESLKQLIQQYGRWSALDIYIERIEANLSSDFSLAIENSKALLESIGKEVCKIKGVDLQPNINLPKLIKQSYEALGYEKKQPIAVITTSLFSAGQQMAELRNQVGVTSHGKTLNQLKERNSKVNELTKDFLIETTSIISTFLIKSIEAEEPYAKKNSDYSNMNYESNMSFNNDRDDRHGEFAMDEYSYTASEVLYNIDPAAYATELMNYEGDYLCEDD